MNTNAVTVPGETLFEYARRIGGEGTLTEPDLRDFQAATHRVYEMLSDHAWHSASEVYDVTKQRDGMRRLRELRQVGICVERDRPDETSREWWYRIPPATASAPTSRQPPATDHQL
jgi:hypothetical protein